MRFLAAIILRGALHKRRSAAAVAAGCALATAVVTAALAMGDSVRQSLRESARSRLHEIGFALTGSARTFGAGLADGPFISRALRAEPALILDGFASNPDRPGLSRKVRLIGCRPGFFDFAGPGRDLDADSGRIGPGRALAGAAAAVALGVDAGADIVVRFRKPSPVALDGALFKPRPVAITRLSVERLLPDSSLGRFAIEPGDSRPLNIFVDLGFLSATAGVPGRANTLLARGDKPLRGAKKSPRGNKALALEAAREGFSLGDAGLELTAAGESGSFRLSTARVFMEPGVVRAVTAAIPEARAISTYLVNSIRASDSGKTTPYSFVAGCGPPLLSANVIPGSMAVNSWLAEDLGASVGDLVELSWFPPDVYGQEERTASFVIAAIVPLSGIHDDQTLMPAVAGLEDAQTCSDWDDSLPLDMTLIRDKDEEYWERHRGSPKAFLSLEDAEAMWGTRLGFVTSLRFDGIEEAALRNRIRSALDFDALGLRVRDLESEAEAAGAGSTDFAALFVGLSMFAAMSGLVLCGLSFAVRVESRREEYLTLRALGFSGPRIGFMTMCDGALLSSAGAVCGVALGAALLHALSLLASSAWSGAVAGAEITPRAGVLPLVFGGLSGAFAGTLASCIAVALAAVPARDSRLKKPFQASLIAAAAAGAFALILVARASAARDFASGAFPAAGALLLVACISLFMALAGAAWKQRYPFTSGPILLALRNAVSGRTRSAAAAAALACGVFIVAAVRANVRPPDLDPKDKASGTGGYALWVETAIPASRAHLAAGLPGGDDVAGASTLAMPRFAGDDASCLNLNRPQVPELLGVDHGALARRGAFTFSAPAKAAWDLMDAHLEDGSVPGIADQSSLAWSLGKSVGDAIVAYDDSGREFRIRIVAALSQSVFQGKILVPEGRFKRLFPSVEGPSVFLLDAASDDPGAAMKHAASAFEPFGAGIETTSGRMASFAEVEASYVGMFTSLGAVGVLIGTAGVACLVLLSAYGRRSELSAMRAMGHTRLRVAFILAMEHSAAVLAGACAGVVSAVAAAVPAFSAGQSWPQAAALVLTIAGVVVVGALSAFAASAWAAKGDLLPPFSEE